MPASNGFASYGVKDDPIDYITGYVEHIGDADYASPVLDAIRKGMRRDKERLHTNRSSNASSDS